MKFIKVYCQKEKSDIIINADHIICLKDMRPILSTTMIYTTKGNYAVSETIDEILEKTK